MSTNPFKIAAKLYEVRDTMRSLLGLNYIHTIEQYGPAIQAEMKRTGKGVLSAGTSLAGAISNEISRLHLVACMVEMAEPDPHFPLSTTSMKNNDTTNSPDVIVTIPERKKERRTLECILTQEQRNEHSLILAKSIQELGQTEDKKKSIVKQIDAEIAEKKAVINKESCIVKDGKEYRDIICEWHLDQPKKGKKQLIRTDDAFADSGIVSTYDMSGEDVQKTIVFEKEIK